MGKLYLIRERGIVNMNTKLLSLEGKYFKAFVFLTLFSLVYILPIILANFYYIDDLGRSLRGYTGWNGNGRPIASLLAIIFSARKPLLDVSPWIQISSVLVFNYSLVLFLKKYITKATAFQIFCVAGFSYLNLFLLENLSYKYDSFGMIFSIGVFLFTYALPESIDWRKQIMISVLSVIVSLSTYQAAIGAYISLIVIECLYFICQDKLWGHIIKRGLLRIVGLGVGGLIYKLVIARIYVSKSGYSAEHASLVNPFTLQGIQQIHTNIIAFSNMLKDYGITLGVLGIVLLVVLGIGLLCKAHSTWHNRKESIICKIVSAGMIVTSPFLLICASVLSLILLKYPVMAPRVMLSLTIFTLFIGIVIYWLSEVKKEFLLVSVLTLICTLSFSSAYGNLLTRQEKMNTLVATNIVYDINRVEAEYSRKIDKVAFIGHSSKCQELLLISKKRPLFARLVPIYMNNNWFWGGQYLSHYRTRLVQLKSDKDDRSYVNSNDAVQENEFYKLYLRNDKLIIVFESK